MCLAVTRHLHFWQNDCTSRHRKLTLDKKILHDLSTTSPAIRPLSYPHSPSVWDFSKRSDSRFTIIDCVYMCRQQQAQPVPNKPHEVSVGIQPSEKQKLAQFWNPGVRSWSCCYYKYWDYPPQSSVAVWQSRWTSWAPVPNKPTVSVDVNQHPTNNHLSVRPKRENLWLQHCQQEGRYFMHSWYPVEEY